MATKPFLWMNVSFQPQGVMKSSFWVWWRRLAAMCSEFPCRSASVGQQVGERRGKLNRTNKTTIQQLSCCS